MSEECETVKVVADNEDGYMVINKSDMTKEHTLFKEKSSVKKPAAKKKK